MPLHSSLAGLAVHEPKGIETAGAMTVYVANGMGSGAWLPLDAATSTVVTVTSESDLPAAVGGSITLDPNTAYFVPGSVTITLPVIASTNNIFYGTSNKISKLILTTTSNHCLTASNANLQLENVTVQAPTSGTFDAIRSTASSDGYNLILRAVIVTTSVTSIHIDRVGLIIDSSVLNFTTKGINMLGNLAYVYIDTLRTGSAEGSAIHIDYNDAVVSKAFVVEFTPTGSGTAISGEAASANIESDIRAEYTNCDFRDITTALAGITTDDVGHNFVNCYGIENSYAAGQASIEGNATATVIAGVGSANSVPVDLSGGTLEVNTDSTSRTTVTGSLRVTNTGRLTKRFNVSYHIFASIAGGASRQYVFLLRKNGTTDLAGTLGKVEMDGSTPSNQTVQGVVSLESNEYIDLVVYQVSGALVNVTVDTASVTAVEV